MPGQHYTDGPLTQTDTWVDSDTYAAILDTVVIACADVLVRDTDGRVLLGLRSRDPHPDWWLFGGRMRRGESFEQAAAENLRRELGVELPAARLRYVASYSTSFQRRAHAPVENGTHTVNALCEVTLTAAEIERIAANDEYRALAWRTPAQIASDRSLHPLLVQALRDAGALDAALTLAA